MPEKPFPNVVAGLAAFGRIWPGVYKKIPVGCTVQDGANQFL
jgi:hypothetical protein